MKFADVLEIRNGKNQRQVENPQGKYPIYGSGGVMGYADDFLCDAETIVIGRKGNINNPIFVNEPFWNVDTAFGLVVNKQLLLPKYLYYFCVNYDFEKLNTTVTIPSLTKANLLQIDINFPELEQQKIIVDNLDKITDLIAIRQSEINLLDRLVKSRFIEMFGDPLINSDRWLAVPITDVCREILGGGTPSKSHAEYFTGTIPWVSPKDMKSAVISDSIDHITEEAISHSTTNLVPSNSVLMVIRSGILKHTLPLAINSTPVTINQDMKAFVPNDKITSAFLMYFFKAIEADVLAGVRGVTADNIDFKAFQQRTIIVPPIELQTQFAKFVTATDKSKYYNFSSIKSCLLAADKYRQEWMMCQTLNF
ncbi:MAG: restriction endonuclease subunit S [Clostridia bacterium]|nr:restriction endonuclease subunit S [Clostridia bacterium]